jgi:hypothetical protein
MSKQLHRQSHFSGYAESVTLSEMRKEIDRIEKAMTKENKLFGLGASPQHFFGFTFLVEPSRKKKAATKKKWKK